MSSPTAGSGTRQSAFSATNTQTQENSQTGSELETRLVLIGSEDNVNRPTTEREPRVSWAEDTIDNEHLNRKKSKICCIYHPPEEFGESEEESEVSSSSSSSSSSESDSDSDSAGKPCCSTKKQKHQHKYRPNAYERPAKPRKSQAS